MYKTEKGTCKNLNIRDMITNFMSEGTTHLNSNDWDYFLQHWSVSELILKISPFFFHFLMK